ncbi:MAG: UDP-glucose 4-epimerase GalE [Methylocapsa sp.]|nr:UDP-glucose 4-epimerase GalE [Methylocapsa sp.]
MPVLVTGGAGYIGGHMVLALLDKGEEVIVLDDLSTGFRWAVPQPAELVIGDTGDAELVTRIIAEFNVDAIIHFAAKIVVPESVAEPLSYYLGNTVKTRSLLQCAVREKVKYFIFSSTAAVYGEAGERPISELAPLAPVNPYGRSKLMSEWMLEDAGRAHGIKFAILRYFNVAGADPERRLGQSGAHATHLIKVAAQTALGLRPRLEIFGTDYPTKDGTCIRDFVQVTDLVNAHLLALDYLHGGGENLVCNCGYGHGLSVREVINAMKQVSGVNFEVQIAGRRPGDSASLVAATGRIRSILGWHPQWDDLEAIVSQALEWEKRLLHNAPESHSVQGALFEQSLP